MTVSSLGMASSISSALDVGGSNLTSTLSVSGAVTLLDDLEMSKVAADALGSAGGGLSITSRPDAWRSPSTLSTHGRGVGEGDGCADGRERRHGHRHAERLELGRGDCRRLDVVRTWTWERCVCGDCIGRVSGDPDNKFTVAGGTGNTVVAGTLNATGATTLSSTLDVAGAWT